jgi:hypothetical protein
MNTGFELSEEQLNNINKVAIYLDTIENFANWVAKNVKKRLKDNI